MLAGVFRSAVSLVVLVVEGTRGINFLFGIIIAVVVANWVANLLEHDGVYESELERDGNVFFLRHEPPGKLATLTAADIMVPKPICFGTVTAVKDVLRRLETSTHHGFPVTDTDARNPESGGRLEGLVLRSQLLVLLKERYAAPCRTPAPMPAAPRLSLSLFKAARGRESTLEGAG